MAAVFLVPSTGSAASPVANCDTGTPAGPNKTTYKCNIPTGTIGGYEVRQWYALAPTPPEDGSITHMETDIVDDVTGEPVPISRLMLHHIVFINLNRQDSTCGGQGYLGFDGRKGFGNFAPQRFYAAGEERAKMSMPPGYGYPTNQSDNWGVVAMVMNHRSTLDHALIHYEVTVDSTPLTSVKPYWFDVRDCRADPIYNVPSIAQKAKKQKKGHKRAEAKKHKKKHKKKKRKKPAARPTIDETRDYTFPESGRLIGGAGHVHGGAIGETLTQPNCGNREVARSDPTWGLPDHPFYNVRPILHEPGPINMSAFGSTTGLSVHKGETLRLNSIYDNSLPHVRVMGIMVVYLAPDPSITQDCSPIPGWTILKTDQPGRTGPVPFKIPLTGLDANGQATPIDAPPGPLQRAPSGAVIPVGDRFFGAPNLRVKKGSTLTWQFNGAELHNLTLANGPLGIGTDNLDAGRTFTQRFERPGTYRFFCALHPVQMQERVVVAPKKKHKKHKKHTKQ
ncbi:MAG TPA: plastocyanin/azurin family copper-binding protein [Solirubrobacterales bacterium]|nr:plastocyanin/azurin family copper-binding protein [Solirubrobacterales bacterium]